MTLPNTSLIRKLTLFLAAAMLSVSAMAADFSQNQRLANQGNAAAQYNLGVMYYKGDGIPQNQSKAIEWFQRAAAQGHIKAESNLKVMSTNAAVEILRKAANQGDQRAQYSLGLIYQTGESVHQDSAKAIDWYTKAANQGNAEAQAMLGGMYYEGEGVPQNVTIAKEWFSKSCDNGDQNGCDAYREFNQEETVFIKNDDRCRPLATLSEGIMDARQSGYSIVEALKAAEDTNGGNVEFYKAIVVAAYSEPKYTTKEDQKNASIEFGIRGYLSCLNALS